MEFRQLHAFCTVANVGSFTRAAELLGYAQSSITTQIQLLEKELGTKLFERFGKRVVLTGQGECFLTYVRQILHLSVEAKEAVSNSDVLKGTITISAPESLCATRLPMVVQEYRKRNPQVKIVLKTGLCDNFCQELKNHIIDIGFFLKQEANDPELIVTTLAAEPMVVTVGVGHPLIKKAWWNRPTLEGRR